jgi:hypothetical protein
MSAVLFVLFFLRHLVMLDLSKVRVTANRYGLR